MGVGRLPGLFERSDTLLCSAIHACYTISTQGETIVGAAAGEAMSCAETSSFHTVCVATNTRALQRKHRLHDVSGCRTQGRFCPTAEKDGGQEFSGDDEAVPILFASQLATAIADEKMDEIGSIPDKI